MSNQDEHLRQLNAELDELRQSLGKLRAQLSLPSGTAPRSETLEALQQHINALKTYVRLLQTDAKDAQRRLEQIEREAWDQRVRRADAAAKLKGRDQLLEQIQSSVAWKIGKPIWRLFHRSRKQPELSGDLVFALNLPKRWVTNRDVLLVKGWCFCRSGRQLAGVRVRIGKKTQLGRYGLERSDVAKSYPGNPAANHCGFTIELKVPKGVSMVQLEAIEQGADWQPFFREQLEREPNADAPEDDELAPKLDEPKDRILKLSALSANKACELVRPGFEQHGARFTSQAPLISIVTPVHNTKPEWLAEAALSLLNQTFSDWEWCLVDDHSDDRETKKLLELLAGLSARVRVSVSAVRGISAANNQALDLARGEYVGFLDHDDLLHPAALEMMRDKLGEGYDVVYSDEDKLEDASGELVEPFFKPDWSPEYLRGAMYVGHLLCVRRELAARTRFDSAFDGVQDFEFMLRLSESKPRVGHIPRILYHWRKTAGSVAERTDAKPHLGLLQERAVNAHLQRMKLPASAEQAALPHRLRVVPERRDGYSRVTIIIPTRDAPEVFGRCLKSIFEKTSYPNFEVVVMDNDTADPAALALIEQYPVRRIQFPGRFNFSRANNRGAEAATGEFLVFLNNDTEVMTKDWLEQLLYYAEQTEVGAAGALLAYDDRTVQHAGVALGMRGTADHVMRRFPIDVDGYAGSLACAREVTAVTAACLMIRASLFQELGGFNEHYFTAYQDVDLCLRLRARGLRIIHTPQAKLVHHESVSRQNYYDMIDRMLLLDQWEQVIERGDPYYNPNLNLQRGDYSLKTS